MPHITTSQFTNRFVSLVLNGRDLPRKPLDRHILLISSILRLDPGRPYSETELNDELHRWTARFGANFALDHVTLRRFLIDEHYLKRDSAGRVYELETTRAPYTFDRSLESLDLDELINQARKEREKRKQDHMKSSQR